MTPPVSATPDESASELTISTAPLSFPPEFWDSCHFQALRAYTWCHSYFYILTSGVRCMLTVHRQFFGESCPRFLPQVQELFFDFECFRLALHVQWACVFWMLPWVLWSFLETVLYGLIGIRLWMVPQRKRDWFFFSPYNLSFFFLALGCFLHVQNIET